MEVFAMTHTLNNLAAGLKFGDPQISGRLTVYPLFFADMENRGERIPVTDESTAKEKELRYLLLEEALDQGTFAVGEVSESGHVNTILVTNMTGEPVLILDGEELIGAKQNRMVNATIMVVEGKTAIPVSCVEQGRWRYEKENFGKSEAFGYSTLRRQKAEQVSNSLKTEASFDADQAAIWEEIELSSRNLGTASPTGAMHDTYSSREDELKDLVENFRHFPGQVGIAVYINNRFTCLDLFDKSKTLQKLWVRLLKSYAVESLNTRSRALKAPRPQPADISRAMETSEYLTYPSVSIGKDLRLNGPNIVGAGLVVDEKIVHLSIFPAGQDERRSNGNIQTPQSRRRNLDRDGRAY